MLLRDRAAAALPLFWIALLSIALARPTSAIEPLAVVEVAPGVFVHAGEQALMSEANEGGIANLAFVVGEEAVAVIDSGGSDRQGRRLLAAIREHTDRPVRWVVNTHLHPDHLFGNAPFAEAGAVIVGHAALPEALAARADFYRRSFARSLGEAMMAQTAILGPDETLEVEEERALDLGGRRLLLRAWPPAHSGTDLTIFDPASGTLFAGDLVFLEHLPVLDGSLLGWLAAMEALAALPAERVVPGHGPPAAPWPEALADQRRYLQRLAEDLRALIARGVPLAAAIEQAAPDERLRWTLFEEYHLRNATAAYAELEWE